VVGAPLLELLSVPHAEWLMSLDERAVLEGVLVSTKPSIAIEIGAASGGSLRRISTHSGLVHSFDLVRHPELTSERFPNVTFHTGDSHELLPAVLSDLASARTTIDFVLVDGDHSARGVRRDLEDLLASPCTGSTVILVHDALNERVRAGLEEVGWERFDNIRFVDLDFLMGRMFRGGSYPEELWGGFGLVITGGGSGRPIMRLDCYEGADVYDAFVAARGRGDPGGRPAYREFAYLENWLADLQSSLEQILASHSWRLTAPLRRANQVMQRLLRR
jgi:hypothetical protein